MMFLLRKDQLYEEYQLYVFWQVHQMQEIRGKIDFTQMNQMIKNDIKLVDWPWSFEGHL